ncbi:VOC family protein [Streptosporangium sp. NPDC001681]|uniref:VOC family protein n=1 Tax=Streptosporangium sp. NPDC001681 TaxID=3154395 RepID=UPI00332F6CF4
MIGNLQCVVLDCPDALALARFYQSLLGGTLNRPDPRWRLDDAWATLHTGSGLVLAFQGVDEYRPPRWPDPAHPQQFHLDIDVADLDQAQQQVLQLGATLLDTGDGTRGWRIYADPAGHPFCLLRGRPGSVHPA